MFSDLLREFSSAFTFAADSKGFHVFTIQTFFPWTESYVIDGGQLALVKFHGFHLFAVKITDVDVGLPAHGADIAVRSLIGTGPEEQHTREFALPDGFCHQK